jgi:hypothetical protein
MRRRHKRIAAQIVLANDLRDPDVGAAIGHDDPASPGQGPKDGGG